MEPVMVYERKYRIGPGEATLPGFRNDIVVLPIVECTAPLAYGYTLDALSKKHSPAPRGSSGNPPIRLKFISHGYGCTHIAPERILVETSLTLLLQNPVFGGIIVYELGCGAFGFKENVEYLAHLRPDTPLIYVRIQPRSYPSIKSLITYCNLGGKECVEEEIAYDEVRDRYGELFNKLLETVASKKRAGWRKDRVLENTRLGVINGASNPSSIISNKTIGELMGSMIEWYGLTVAEGQFSELVPEKIMRLAAGNHAVESKLMEMFKRSLTFKQAPGQPEPTPGNIRGGIPTLEVKQVMTTLRVPYAEIGLPTGIGLKAISIEDMIRRGRELIKNIKKGLYEEASLKMEELIGLKGFRRGLILVESAGYDPMTGNVLAMLGVQAIYFTTGLGTPWGSLVPTIKVTADKHAWERYGGPNGFIDYYIDPSKGSGETHRDLEELLLKVIGGEWLRHEYNQLLLEYRGGNRVIGWETYNLTLQQLYMRA